MESTVPYAPAAPSHRLSVDRVLPYLVILALGLWAGGLVTLILFVSTLFVKARAVAFDAAPVLFDAFEKYQLILAAFALTAVVAWRLSRRTKFKTAALACTMLATLLAFVQIGYITPTIERSRATDRPTFDRYHRLASTNYTIISGFVLVALGLSVAANKRSSSFEGTRMNADERR